MSQCFVPSMFWIVSGLIFPFFIFIFRAQIYFLFVGVCLLFAERSAAFVLCLPLLPEQLMHNQSTSPAGCAVASLPRTPTLYGRISPIPPCCCPAGSPFGRSHGRGMPLCTLHRSCVLNWDCHLCWVIFTSERLPWFFCVSPVCFDAISRGTAKLKRKSDSNSYFLSFWDPCFSY